MDAENGPCIDDLPTENGDVPHFFVYSRVIIHIYILYIYMYAYIYIHTSVYMYRALASISRPCQGEMILRSVPLIWNGTIDALTALGSLGGGSTCLDDTNLTGA